MPEPLAPDDALRAALHGVRALVLDADGVLVLKGRGIPGVERALDRLATLGIPYRIVTNYSSSHRETLAARFSSGGLVVGPERVITAASAAAAHTATAYADAPLYVIARPDALREFDGQHLLTADEAAAPGAIAAAVVIGDAGDEVSFANLDAAFRLARGGAELLAMHRNPWWITSRGVTLDSGALVAGLEFALGRRARVLGKPSPVVFRQAAAGLAADLGERRLAARSIAMVGDDLGADLAPARRLGMRTVLALTGKTEADGVDAAVAKARFAPDAVAPSITDIAAALG